MPEHTITINGTPGTRATITNELARVVGLVAQRNPESALSVRWFEGADERDWLVTVEESGEHFWVDDETGHWCPASHDDLVRLCAVIER